MNGSTLGDCEPGSNLHHPHEHHGSVSQSMCINHWAMLQHFISVYVYNDLLKLLFIPCCNLLHRTLERSVCMMLSLGCTSPPHQLLYILLRVAQNASRLTEAVDVSLCGCEMYVLCFKHAICFYVYKNMHMLIWKMTVGESMWVSLSLSVAALELHIIVHSYYLFLSCM